MRTKIKWINTNESGQPDEAGNWESADGRFVISPRYRHTVYPDSYQVRDGRNGDAISFDRVRDCKWWAQGRINKEQSNGQ